MPRGIYNHHPHQGFQKENKICVGMKHTEKTKEKIRKSQELRLSNPKIRERLIGKKNPNWKGGKRKHQGRWLIWKPNHPFATKAGCVRRSRLIAEKYLGRYLTKKEIIHHIGEKNDDRPKMLYLFPSDSAHASYHSLRDKPELVSNLI